jgi:hypothetical protein
LGFTTNRRGPRLLAVCTAACFALGAPVPIARADVTSQDRTIAQALFDDGKRLLNDGRYAEACAKFDSSQKLDPSLGTLLNLAVCREREGKLATAWERFREAEVVAKRERQVERQRLAEGRAASLEPRLSRVTVTVPPESDVPGLEVRLDRATIDRAAWGTAIPVDGGKHHLAAEASGRTAWETELDVQTEGDSRTVPIPALAPIVAPPVQPPPPPPSVATPPSVAPTLTVETPPARGSSSVATVGLVTAGVGVAGIATGAVFGLLTSAAINRQKSDCASPTSCGDHDQALRDHSTAVTDGSISTVAFAAGGVLLVSGTVLFLAGRARSTEHGAAFELEPSVAPGCAGLRIRGAF